MKGPIPLQWIRDVNRSRATLCLGLYLWFKKGVGESPIKVSPRELRRRWGLLSRRSVYGALAELESAGLIEVVLKTGQQSVGNIEPVCSCWHRVLHRSLRSDKDPSDGGRR